MSKSPHYKKKTQLTIIEAASIVMGSGVGGGIMAVPYLAALSGIIPFLVILIISLAINLIIHLMLVEVMLREGSDKQIVELIKHYLLNSGVGIYILQGLFFVLLLSFLANLSAYLQGSSEILGELTGLSEQFARILVYVLSASIVFFGLKKVGIFEKYALFTIIIIFGVIITGTVSSPFHINFTKIGDPISHLSLFGMVMYSFFAFFSVPQAVKGLAPQRRLAVKAVILGTVLNGLLISFLTIIAIGVSHPVTEIAIIGIGDAAGKVVRLAGLCFILLAMMTSFWSISLALADIIRERTGSPHWLSWLFATLPPLLLTYAKWFTFTEFLKIAAGIVALILIMVMVPLYLKVKKNSLIKEPEWSLGRAAHPLILILIILAAILMGLGAIST